MEHRQAEETPMPKKTGIVFRHKAKHRKLVDIEWGTDNSFYFMPCTDNAQIGERIKTERDPEGRLVLSIDEIQERSLTKRFTGAPTSAERLSCWSVRDCPTPQTRRTIRPWALRARLFELEHNSGLCRLAPSFSASRLFKNPSIYDMIVHLIDGTYELFRHYYGLRRRAPKGTPFGAVRFVRDLSSTRESQLPIPSSDHEGRLRPPTSAYFGFGGRLPSVA
jgi:hypothetical protein